MIPFNKAVYLPKAAEYVEETLKSSRIAGDGKYTRLCTEWMELILSKLVDTFSSRIL